MPKKSKALREIAAMKHEATLAVAGAEAALESENGKLFLLTTLEDRLTREAKVKKPSKARETVVKQFNDEAKMAFEKMRAAANTADE